MKFTKLAEKFIKKHIFKRKLLYEPLTAYYDRLPDEIQVSWKRDGNFIIGWIAAGDNKFMTQAYNAKEFIEMVNDAVIAVYNIPEDYIDTVAKLKTYNPPSHEFDKLKDSSISESTLGFVKNKKILELVHN